MDFFCKLVAPRPTFGQDMTPDEGQLMQRHAIYWKELMGRGHVVTFGVVADPREVFGIAVVTFGSEAEVRAATDADPVIRADAGFSFEIHPMPFGATRP
ncbi:YciI family protein [Longimicrobium sp.]|uniref:YciI family protein n=1 Tax=Longimicrobium sp. TaxID=2029185 RepID=UPI003B3B621F